MCWSVRDDKLSLQGRWVSQWSVQWKFSLEDMLVLKVLSSKFSLDEITNDFNGLYGMINWWVASKRKVVKDVYMVLLRTSTKNSGTASII